MATNNARRPRIAVAAAVATTLVAAFAALGGVGVAESAISAVQYQYGHKVAVCHKGKKTISISKNAVPAHVRHGDTVGTCASAKAKKAKAAKLKAAKIKAAKAKAKAAKAKAAEKRAEKGKSKPVETETESESSERSDNAKGNGKGKGRGK